MDYYNEDYLAHFGIKGMKWGVRRYQNPDGSLTPKGAKRYAKKDAKEYARAKMFYGEGAGTRRKHINATVNQRSKDPEYKKAFDEALSKQDMSKHAAKAKRERKVRDAGKATAKTGRGVVNALTGHPERLGAGMLAAYTGYQVAHRTGFDKFVAKKTKDMANTASAEYGKWKVKQLLKRSLK